MLGDFLLSVALGATAAVAEAVGTAGPVVGATAAAAAGATAAAAGDSSPGGGWIGTVVPLAAMFAIFYFLLIRPQQKRQKQHAEFVKSLARGKDVVLNSGIIGRIAAATDSLIVLEIAPNVRIRVQRGQIASLASEGDLESGRTALAGLGGGSGTKKIKGKGGKPAEPETEAPDTDDDSGDGDADSSESAEKAAS